METTTRYSRISLFDFKTYTVEIPLAPDLFYAALESYAGVSGGKSNLLIEEAFPTLSPSHREFIMTGCTSEEWQKMFGDSEDREGSRNEDSEDEESEDEESEDEESEDEESEEAAQMRFVSGT